MERRFLRSQRAESEARCSRQSGRTSFSPAPHAEQRRRQRRAGVATASESVETSTPTIRPQSEVAKIERAPRLRMWPRRRGNQIALREFTYQGLSSP